MTSTQSRIIPSRPDSQRERLFWRKPQGAGQTLLHIVAQNRIDHQLGRLGPACRAVGVPPRGRCPILQTSRAGGGIAPQFPGNGRGRSPQLASDLPHANPPEPAAARSLPAPQTASTVLKTALPMMQTLLVAYPRLSEPSCSHRRRHVCHRCRILARLSRRNCSPEPLTILTLRRWGSARRPQWSPSRSIRSPILLHRNLLHQAVATTA